MNDASGSSGRGAADARAVQLIGTQSWHPKTGPALGYPSISGNSYRAGLTEPSLRCGHKSCFQAPCRNQTAGRVLSLSRRRTVSILGVIRLFPRSLTAMIVQVPDDLF